MKKFGIIIAVIFVLTAVSFAQDATSDNASAGANVTAAADTPDTVTAATSRKPNVKAGVSVDVKDKNYLYTSPKGNDDWQQSYSRYRNKANIQAGALININDKVIVSPYVRAHNIDFQTKDIYPHAGSDNSNDLSREFNLRFKSGALKTGIGVSADASSFVSLACNLFQWTYFAENQPVWVGLGYSMALDFSIAKAFLDINFWDEVSVRFAENNGTNSLLLNLFDYGFRFNFFNFIDKRINTGLYAVGEFELDLSSTDGNYVDNYLYNEVYIGIKSSPIPFLDFWLSYFVQASANYNDDCSQKLTTGLIEMGLETGAAFKYNGFTLSINYEPKFWRFTDKSYGEWSQLAMSQSMSITLGYKFKTYFQKK